MRMWIAIPIAVAATAAIGFAGCKALGFDPHLKEMSLAAAACLIAGELAIIPLSRTSVPTQANVAQAVRASTATVPVPRAWALCKRHAIPTEDRGAWRRA